MQAVGTELLQHMHHQFRMRWERHCRQAAIAAIPTPHTIAAKFLLPRTVSLPCPTACSTGSRVARTSRKLPTSSGSKPRMQRATVQSVRRWPSPRQLLECEWQPVAMLALCRGPVSPDMRGQHTCQLLLAHFSKVPKCTETSHPDRVGTFPVQAGDAQHGPDPRLWCRLPGCHAANQHWRRGCVS